MSLGGDVTWLRRSSTLRLTLVLSTIFALCMAAAVYLALVLGSDAFERRVDTTLQALARASSLEGERGDTFGVILRAPDDIKDLPPAFADIVLKGGGTIDLEDDFRQSDTWRVLVSSDSQGVPVLAAVPLDDGEDALELLEGILWSTVAIMLVMTMLVGLTTGVFAQRRLKQINETLTALAAGDLTARTGSMRTKDDLDDMARQVDVTAGELERLVAQTRHLSASLAHDLRTPLARLRARLETLPDGEERGAALEEAERLSGIFDTIMRVARIEAAQGTDGFEEVDLAALVEDLGETFDPVIEDDGKTLVLDIAPTQTVFADKQMLVQAMANLIQNAMRHGGEKITLTARGRSMGVADNGAGVDPANFAEILKPMVRLDTARKSEGTGLGLALVRAVADRHGAELALSQNDPQGLAVTMNFAKM
jgi:signal transduction histidine kinase